MAVVDPRGRGSGGTEDGATTGKKIDENKVPLRMLLLMRAPRNYSRSYRVRRWGVGTKRRETDKKSSAPAGRGESLQGGGKDAAAAADGGEGEVPDCRGRCHLRIPLE